jgi:hypothetical protein
VAAVLCAGPAGTVRARSRPCRSGAGRRRRPARISPARSGAAHVSAAVWPARVRRSRRAAFLVLCALALLFGPALPLRAQAPTGATVPRRPARRNARKYRAAVRRPGRSHPGRQPD